MNRRVGVASAILAIALVLAGCVPEPEPTPTPTGFASEEEAFAAAEATYRAYVDALNQVDLSDPETFEPVYALTTGEINSDDRERFSTWHADGYSISGAGQVTEIRLLSASGEAPDTISVEACYRVADIDVRDAAGVSVVASDRPDVQPLRVDFVSSATSPTELVISNMVASGDISCSR